MAAGSIVGDFRTLNALARAGYVTLNGRPSQTERHWTGGQVKVITVRPGPRLESSWQRFTHRGTEYQIQYFDGCFHPFVTRTGVPRPAFV